MLKKKVRVHIEGRNYALITTEDTKYVKRIADEVIAHIRKTATGPTQLDTRDCAILAALDFCDERIKADNRSQEVIDKADKIIQKNNELNKLCSEYKEKLTEAINENTALSKQVKALENQLALLKKGLKTADTKNTSLNKTTEHTKTSSSKDDTAKPARSNKHDQSIKPAQNDTFAQYDEAAKKFSEENQNKKLLGYVPMRQYSLFEDDNKNTDE